MDEDTRNWKHLTDHETTQSDASATEARIATNPSKSAAQLEVY